jgi:hypothetical protein
LLRSGPAQAPGAFSLYGSPVNACAGELAAASEASAKAMHAVVSFIVESPSD